MTSSGARVVLLVDDNEDARDIYSEYLTLSGYRVVTATNGREALTQARQVRPDLILMDIRMPELSGYDALRLLREPGSALASTPVIALTAHALADEQRDALRRGFDLVITKPCLPDELARAVGEFLNSRSSGA